VGRRSVITPTLAEQLAALLDCGVTQERAALAVGISRRTVQRFASRRKQHAEPQTLEQVLAEIPSLDQVIAAGARARPRPGARRKKRASESGWEQVARMLETDVPERWARRVNP
jgi:hypothetical protein